MTNEKEFIHLSESTLIKLADQIENNDPEAIFDVEYSDGILTIIIDDQTYVINKHSASQKIWFSSPISGADYFSYNNQKQSWISANSQELENKLLTELKTNFNLNYDKK